MKEFDQLGFLQYMERNSALTVQADKDFPKAVKFPVIQTHTDIQQTHTHTLTLI